MIARNGKPSSTVSVGNNSKESNKDDVKSHDLDRNDQLMDENRF